MFIWDLYLHIIVYVCDTVVVECGAIINFHVINICSQDPTQSEMLEEETSPVIEEINETEKYMIALFYGATIFNRKGNVTQVWMYQFFHLLTVQIIVDERR